MTQKNEKLRLGESGFWPSWISKFLFTLISVKVWGLVACTWISTWLLLNSFLEKGQWLTFNTTIWALIFGMKEIFRIAEKRDSTEQENLKEYFDSKLKISSMMSNAPDASKTTFTKEGFEIVGDEPDTEI